jgi:polyisoprenoid-binding protein YceI
MKKIKTMIMAVAIVAAGISAKAQSTWSVDKSHSKVQFSITHLMISETVGQFKIFDGKVTTTNDDFQGAKIEFTIDVNSINTDDENRDKHLKSPDFFDTEKYPTMTFKSITFNKVDGKNYKMIGELTMKGVTKKVEFDVVYNGTVKDPWGNTKAGFKLKGTINRVDFGLAYNSKLEAGGMMLGEIVNVSCDIEIAKAK